jgi:hypothetical protein
MAWRGLAASNEIVAGRAVNTADAGGASRLEVPRRHVAGDRRQQLDPAADGSGASGATGGRRRHDGPRLSRGADAGETGFEIVRKLYRQDFDPAFTSTAKIDYAIGIPLTHLGAQ